MWIALRVRVPVEHEEELVGLLSPDCHGFEVGPTVEGGCLVTAYLRAGADTESAIGRATQLLEQHGCGERPRIEEVEDGRWVERYQASLRPFRVGRRFTVYPGGRAPDKQAGEPLLLVPGRAFGTGEHATTQLCVEQLEQRVESGSRWLDLGCGNGILTLVALRCGAGEVRAVDDDPEAVRVARQTLATNGVREGFDLRTGSIGRGAGQDWDGVVCNIGASFFLQHAAGLARLPRRGAPLLATGFHACDLPEVRRALEEAGLRAEEDLEKSPWALLVARRS